MVTTRRPIARIWRPGAFNPEAVRLFAELERTPKRRRNSEQWEADRLRLNRMLDVGIPGMWMSVNDAEPEPDADPASPVYRDWRDINDKRHALLEAARAAGLLP
jgi:hypothetical protein